MKVDAVCRQSGIDDVAVGAKDAVACLTEDRGQDRIIAVLSAFGQTLLIDVGGHLLNAGFDLFSPREIEIEPNAVIKIDTGVHVAIPEGFVGLVLGRSSFGVAVRPTSGAS